MNAMVDNNLIGGYFCGGAGINLSQLLAAMNVGNIPTLANVNTVMLDTSDSNKPEGDHENFYQIPGMDGAGKDRSKSYKIVNDKVDEILNLFKPRKMNIVVYSESGGSGSVIGPLILCELKKRGHSAIGVVVGSTLSAAEANNTMKTEATHQVLAERMAKKNITRLYLENAEDSSGIESPYTGKRGDVDKLAIDNILKLLQLFSGCNKELDDEDIVTWDNFDRLIEVPPGSNDLIITSDKNVLEKYKGTIISIASILVDRTSEAPNVGAMVSTHGYYDESHYQEDAALNDFYFIITPALRESRLARLKSVCDNFEKQRLELAERSRSSAAEVGNVTDDAFVL